MSGGFWGHLRSHMGRGLLLVLPLLITLWLLGLLFGVVQGNVTPLVMGILRLSGVEQIDRWPSALPAAIGIVLTATFVYLLGLLAANLVGKRILNLVEAGILRIPLVKGIYGSARQLLDAFSMTGTRAFSSVVLLEYPRRGMWTVGFLTAEIAHRIGAAGGEPDASYPVFLPTTPNPTSGWLVLVPSRDLHRLEMTVEEAVKLIVSGGIVSPADLGDRIRPWTAASLPPAG